ncbi:type IV pili methyl-accepting chemotaxis transducer N-terminal domain-containing protein [Undibacterium sp. RuTC16W]|uniref:type IV pili methyl-accepting chemotaxis transducer N-terminal domain-containing protein n=1 Tax=Undibacterium sp. RuTC16W TaxID=3413048 RepID=UPI003BF3AD6D
MKNFNYKKSVPPVFFKRRGIFSLPLLGFLPALVFSQSARAEVLALSTAINRSGRIRALSQRLAKAHIQIALGVLPGKAQEIVITAQALILRNLSDLKTVQSFAPVLLARVEADSKTLINAVNQTPSKASSLEVSDLSDVLLASAEKLTAAFEGQGKNNSAKLINTAGRQRMLSQRVSKLYFLSSAGHSNPTVKREMENARAQFKTGLMTLASAPVTTPNIKAFLELGRTQWMFMEDALTKPTDAVQMRNVATSSERVLEVMNDLADEYDLALKEILGLASNSTTQFAMLNLRSV